MKIEITSHSADLQYTYNITEDGQEHFDIPTMFDLLTSFTARMILDYGEHKDVMILDYGEHLKNAIDMYEKPDNDLIIRF